MKRFDIPQGTAVLSFSIIISAIAIFLAGWSLAAGHPAHSPSAVRSTDTLGYHPISTAPEKGNPWWESQKKQPGEKAAPRKQKKRGQRNLSQPNIGLKDPANFSWPYGDEFTYEADIRNEDLLPPGTARNARMVNRYYTDDTGAKLEEETIFRSGFDTMTIGADVEFDEHYKAEIINLYIGSKENFPSAGEPPTKEMRFVFEHKGDKVQLRAKIPRDIGTIIEPGIYDREFYAPDDGFFFFTGSDTPGFTALLLSVVDLDCGKPVQVWVFSGSLWLILGEEAEEIHDLDQFLSYITINDLNNCTPETRKWWEDSRKYFNGWRPPEGVRTIVFMGDTETFFPYYNEIWSYGTKAQIADICKPHGPFAIAYMDNKGRVIRIEQPGGFLYTAADLKAIGGEKTWWGK